MFNGNIRPGIFKKIRYIVTTIAHYNFRIRRNLSSVAAPPVLMNAREIVVYGPNISIGKNVFMYGPVRLTSIQLGAHEGHIFIGNSVLITPGVRVSSAVSVTIGDHCMLGNHCYIMDSDWHDIYDRNIPVGDPRPVILEENVWVGDSAIICKGVRIGKNSVVGAGSVVRRDVPANTVVAGNPARTIRKLDPRRIVPYGAGRP